MDSKFNAVKVYFFLGTLVKNEHYDTENDNGS